MNGKIGEMEVERLDLSLDDLIGMERKAARATGGRPKDPRPTQKKSGVGQMSLGAMVKPTKKKGQPRKPQGNRRGGQEQFRGNSNQVYRLHQANAAAEAALMPPRGGQHAKAMAQRPRRNQGMQRARTQNQGVQQYLHPPSTFRNNYGGGNAYTHVSQGGRSRQPTARSSGYNHRMDSSNQGFPSNHNVLGVSNGGVRKVSSRQMRLSSTVHKPQTLSDRFNAYRTTGGKRSPGNNMGGGVGRERMNGGGGMGYGGSLMPQRHSRRGVGQYKTGVSGGRAGFGQNRRDNLRVVLNN